MAKKIIRHELVEVVIPSGSTATRFVIPDLPNLRNVHIFGLQAYSNNNVPKGIQTQNAVITPAVLETAFLTLVNYGGKEFLKQAPAVMFQTLYKQTNIAGGQEIPTYETDVKAFVGQRVNYPKSFVEFSAPPAIAGVTTTFMFSVFYALPAAEEKKESGFSFSKRA
jgi:hypothetical protein